MEQIVLKTLKDLKQAGNLTLSHNLYAVINFLSSKYILVYQWIIFWN